MITPGKIDEWLREVEERPESAGLIIRYITNRLKDLSERNEALQNENIALVTEKKIEQYQERITRLEYQLELLKRQVSQGGGMPESENRCLLVFSKLGGILRRRIDPLSDFAPGQILFSLQGAAPAEEQMRLAVVGEVDELLILFNSGRTQRIPVDDVPLSGANPIDWRAAQQIERRGSETIANILSIGRMALSDYAVQVSRKGCLKKVTGKYFQSYVAKDNIGTGVKAATDETFGVVLCCAGETLVLVSREGELMALNTDHAPVAIQEMFKLGATDHVVSAFVLNKGDEIALMNSESNLYRYLPSWLGEGAPEQPIKRALFSKLKRAEGLRVVSACPAVETDWGLALTSDGRIISFPLEKATSSGVKAPGLNKADKVVDFTVTAWEQESRSASS